MSPTSSLIRLKTSIQTYDWGKTGSSSVVAKLAVQSVGTDFKIERDKSYAEIWMGTHPNGPSYLFDDPSKSLQSLIESNPSRYLGTLITQNKFPSTPPQIPYLFKILSMAKALPLQAHPDKSLAEQLYKNDKEHKEFVDSNHKPEIAVALKDGFRGFVGFRPHKAVKQFFEGISELRDAVGNESVVRAFIDQPCKETLSILFSTLLNRPESELKGSISTLVAKIAAVGAAATVGDEDVAYVVRGLQNQYPGDVGVLVAPFFMNLVTLMKGEAVYIGADEAHAYLEGDIIECMAVSDNVLNGAFVPPSARQTSVFQSMLTYTARPASHWALPSAPYEHSKHDRTTKYDPPLEEFVVLDTELHAGSGTGEEVLDAVGGPTIGIVTSGKMRFSVDGESEVLELGTGGVVFVLPGKILQVELIGEEDNGEVWWATCM